VPRARVFILGFLWNPFTPGHRIAMTCHERPLGSPQHCAPSTLRCNAQKTGERWVGKGSCDDERSLQAPPRTRGALSNRLGLSSTQCAGGMGLDPAGKRRGVIRVRGVRRMQRGRGQDVPGAAQQIRPRRFGLPGFRTDERNSHECTTSGCGRDVRRRRSRSPAGGSRAGLTRAATF